MTFRSFDTMILVTVSRRWARSYEDNDDDGVL